MESIRIVTNSPKDKVREMILSYPFNSKVQVKNEVLSNSEIFIFNIDKHRLEELGLFNALSKMIQNIINRVYLKDMIDTKVSIILQDFIQSDIDEVSKSVYNFLLDENYFIEDRKVIDDEIKDYLLESNTLILDGYLKFRSRSFENLIDKIIEKVILDIQLESEYEDFVEMLQYYLETQIPKTNIVNVVIKNNQFYLYDERKRPIENSSIKSIMESAMSDDDVSKADILVSSLIVLAPNKVIIHLKNDKERELMQILKRIFEHKLSFCYSCDLCDNNQINSDNND